MTDTKTISQLIIDESKNHEYLGQWADFCRETGLTRHQVFFWRKKLGLAIRAPAGAAGRRVDGTNECPEQLRGILR
jgi:hypothetical protein